MERYINANTVISILDYLDRNGDCQQNKLKLKARGIYKTKSACLKFMIKKKLVKDSWCRNTPRLKIITITPKGEKELLKWAK